MSPEEQQEIWLLNWGKIRPDTDGRGLSFSHDELTVFGFREQNQNEDYKQT